MRYGIRELKDGSLSRAVRKASHGEDVVITDHGRPVARIVAYPEPPLPRNIQDLVAAGRLEVRVGPHQGLVPQAELTGPKSAADYLREQRR